MSRSARERSSSGRSLSGRSPSGRSSSGRSPSGRSPYRILSLDGGGLRGIITAILLERLEAACPGFLSSIDLFVGTSTGGILALALAAGFPPDRIITLYEEQGDVIFSKTWGRKLTSLGKLVGAEYDNENLRDILNTTFGETMSGKRRLGDLEKRVAIPAFRLDSKHRQKADDSRTWAPKIFHNYEGFGSDSREFVADVALYTSSAPTYFPSAEGYIDGGVVANNPSMVAVAQALDSRCQLPPEEPRDLEDLVLLSVGTGASRTYLRGDRLDWGLGQWARPLLDILIDGVSEVADFQCHQLLGARYERLQVLFGQDEKLPMDDYRNLSLLITYGRIAKIDATVAWIKSQEQSPGSM